MTKIINNHPILIATGTIQKKWYPSYLLACSALKTLFCSCLSSLLIAECVNDQIDLGGLCCFSNQVNDNGQCQDSCDSPKIDNEGVCHCPAALIENDYDGECSKCCS